MSFFQADGIGSILSTILFIAFFIFYPRLYIAQMVWKLESDMEKLQAYAVKSEEAVLKKVSNKPDKKLKEAVSNFMNFFVSTPVDIDPYGIVRKLEHIMNESERRFNYFVEQIAPKMGNVEKSNLKFGLFGALGVNQIYKVIRHYVLTIKKTNNLQLAMILQMSMPMLMKIAKANVKATRAFLNGIPIGDAIGPMVASSFKTKDGDEIAREIVVSKERVAGKDIFVMKSKGPQAALGKVGHAVEALHKKYKIDHIITVDAAAKLEGEETGSLAEGVGIMMGGIGVERSQIEDVAVKYDIPVDGIVIKMSPMEASVPMPKKVYDALPHATEKVATLVKGTKSKKILLLGVGNTCGIGNQKTSLKGVDGKLKPFWRKQAENEKKAKEKKFKWFRQDDNGNDDE